MSKRVNMTSKWKVDVGDRTDHCIITKVLIEL